MSVIELCKCGKALEPASHCFNGREEFIRGNHTVCYDCFHAGLEPSIAAERIRAAARAERREKSRFNCYRCGGYKYGSDLCTSCYRYYLTHGLHLQPDPTLIVTRAIKNEDPIWDDVVRAYEEANQDDAIN